MSTANLKELENVCELCDEEFLGGKVKSLPCGRTVCELCENDLKTNLHRITRVYECKLCKSLHKMAKFGLPVNLSLMEKLNELSEAEARAREAREEYDAVLGELSRREHEFKFSYENAVGEHFGEVRKDVQLSAESCIEHNERERQEKM